MMNAARGLRKVAVLLSGREQFSPRYGGAVARWSYEVYSRLSDRRQLSATVFAYPGDEAASYRFPHESSRAFRACTLLAKIPYARRYEETLWLGSLIGWLRKFGVIHLHNRPQWPAILRKFGYEGAIVLHLHNDHLGHWAAADLDRLAAETDAVAVCSEFLRNTFAAKSAALAGKTKVVYNGANRKIFFPREEVRECATIFFVGRFAAEKGVVQLLRAYDRVLDRHPNAKLTIGGSTGFGKHAETAYVRQVRDFALELKKRQRGQIEFTGFIDHDRDLPRYFQRATLFACPSLFQEPFGLVNAEAMACATPVVGAHRGGIPEVIAETGRLIDPENSDEFAGAISNLLADPQECRRLGQAAYERCRSMFDWDVTAERWMELIESVV